MDFVRKRPDVFRALGASDPPLEVNVGGRTYRRGEVFKHDSWAATAIYEDDAGTQITCKFNRQQAIFVIPMKWLGRWLAGREAWFLRELADVETIPDDLGPVRVGNTVARHAIARVYIDGAPLMKCQRVNDRFFDQLLAMIATMHQRGMAYVDLNKKENIVVGSDGQPYLIDFQISFRAPRNWLGRTWLVRWIHAQLATIDCMRVAKHLGDCRPDLLREAELEVTPPRLLRMHRAVIKPLRRARRRLLVGLSVRSGKGFAETELEPEDAVRRRLRQRGD